MRRAQRELTPEERKRRWLRGGLYGCGGCLGVVLVVVILLAFLAKATPPLPPELEHARQEAAAANQPADETGARPTPPEAPAGSPTAAPAAPASQPAPVEDQVRALEQAWRQGYSGSFRILVSEAELNREISSALGKGAAVAVLDGEIVATSTAEIGPGSTAVTWLVRAQPLMQGGQPRVVITQAYLGRIPAPGALVQKAQAELDKAFQRALAKAQGVIVTNIIAQRGLIIIEGRLAERR